MSNSEPVQLPRELSHPPRYIQALLGTLPLTLGMQLLLWLVILPVTLGGHSDFRQLYAAGYMVRTGHAKELYQYNAQLQFQNETVSPAAVPLPFIRPACYALLFVPFSLLPYREAYFAFMCLNLVLLSVSYWILRPWLQHLARTWSWLPALIFLGFFPVTVTLTQGQDSIVLLALLAATFAYLNRGRELSAGMLTGLGLFKFQIVIPIALLFLAWRRWRFTLGFATSSLWAGVLSVGLVGWEQSQRYARSLISMNADSSSRANDLSYPIPVRYMANLHGLVLGVWNGRLPTIWVTAMTIALSAIVCLWVAWATPRHVKPVEAFPAAIAASVVVSYYLFVHDLSVLLIPMSLLLNRQAETEPTQGRRQWVRVAGWIAFSTFIATISYPFIPQYRYLISFPVCALLFVLVWHGRHGEVDQAPGGPTWPTGNLRALRSIEAP